VSTNATYYLDQLYPLQDRALQVIASTDTGFYLTGGTAVSRLYLEHRFSDDLDLFVNYDKRFRVWSSAIIQACQANPIWQVAVTKNEDYFARIILTQDGVALKVELVNDVPAHVGEFRIHPVLGRVDSPENILANKITALVDRNEARDLADVWGLCTKLGLSIKEAITGAQSKAIGVYPADIARRLCTVTERDWRQVLWIDPPPFEQYRNELIALGEGLILV
jgi:hypothetical protein